MEERDEASGLGASAQADGDGGENKPAGEPTETADAPKVADPDSGEDDETTSSK